MATEWATWPRATDEEMRSWSAARGDDAGRAARSHADLTAENQALRERAEAAERERDGAIQWRNHYRQSWLDCRDTLTAARRAESAAWNDAIEAVEAEALQYVGPGARETVREIIRALRRAAPTEGEA